MYNLEAVIRKLKKGGVDSLISDLTSNDLSEDAKKELTDSGILVGGYPNLSLIYNL